MRTAEALKRSVWIAAGTVTDGVRQFAAPVEYKLNYRNITSAADIMAFGIAYTEFVRVVTSNEYVENVNDFDRVWLDATPADPTDLFARDANFYVYSKALGAGGVATLMLKRLGADD